MDQINQEIDGLGQQGTALVVASGPTALATTRTLEELASEYEADRKRAEDLQKELDDLKKASDEFEKAGAELRHRLNSKPGVAFEQHALMEACRELEDVEEQVDALRRELYAHDEDEPDFVEPSEDLPEDEPVEVEAEANSASEDISCPRNVRRACKKLYSKISSRTHPDKTSDPDLNSLFLVAASMYKRLDLPGLEGVWEALQGGSVRRSSLKMLIAKLSAELDEVRAKLFNMLSSEVGELMRMNRDLGFETMSSLYTGSLRRQSISARMALRKLKGTLQDLLEEKTRRRVANINVQIEEAGGVEAWASLTHDSDDIISLDEACD